METVKIMMFCGFHPESYPVRWECGEMVVSMDFDRMGRRVFYKEMKGNTQVTFTRFIYKDYLCVQQVFSNNPYNTYKTFIWDPTEPIATRPLALKLPTMSLNLFYLHDGNKNVSDVIYRLTSNGIAAHYDYAPFGAVTRTCSNAVPTADITTLNPFRFSSEYHDDTLGLVYYNYRHYNSTDGRWLSTDILSFYSDYTFLNNSAIYKMDFLGNIDTLFVIEEPPLSLDRKALLKKRHGENWHFQRNPIAFTRARVVASFTCYCDDSSFNQFKGEITATMYISTYIYDENDAVRLISNQKKATREDVLSHEKEHAKDCALLFYQVFTNRQDKVFYMTFEECNRAMNAEIYRLNQEMNRELKHYVDSELNLPKFQKRGAYFVEGSYL